MDGMSLLDVLRGVMLDPAEQAAYNADPGAYLARYGYDDVDSADLSEAFGLVADTLPPEVAQAAWQASADHGDGPFGGVSPEFDSQVGVDAAPDPAPEPDAGPPAGGDGEPEPALSFGYGEADFADAGTANLTAAEAGVGSDDAAGTDQDASVGPGGADGDLSPEDIGDEVDDVDEAATLDEAEAVESFDDGWEDDAGAGLGQPLGEHDGLGLDDVGGDTSGIDGLDGLDGGDQLDGLDDGVDSTDIGSF
jgi:hypothetical protein